MKYFVQVNRNMMVSIEAETALRAEHAILDMDGIQYANAFDTESMKTETFRGAMMSCNTMSLDELCQLSGDYSKAWQAVGKAKDAWNTADSEVRRIEAMLERAKEEAKEAERAYFNRYNEAKGYSIALNIEDC